MFNLTFPPFPSAIPITVVGICTNGTSNSSATYAATLSVNPPPIPTTSFAPRSLIRFCSIKFLSQFHSLKVSSLASSKNTFSFGRKSLRKVFDNPLSQKISCESLNVFFEREETEREYDFISSLRGWNNGTSKDNSYEPSWSSEILLNFSSMESESLRIFE